MKYTSNFYSLSGERYDLSIITNHNSGTTKEITLGVPPFVTEMDEDEENIYKSVKYQSATVSIIASGETDYMLQHLYYIITDIVKFTIIYSLNV